MAPQNSGRATARKAAQHTASSPDRIVAAIREWTARHGRVPTEQDWQRAGAGHPSARTVVQRFGSWLGALAAAGYVLEPGHRAGPRSATAARSQPDQSRIAAR